MDKPENDEAADGRELADPVVGLLKTVMLAIAVALVGGYLAGLVICEVGEVGSISIWGLGFLAGLVARQIGIAPSIPAAWVLIAACIAAALISEICWIRWNIQGADSWQIAIRMFPQFVQDYKTTVFVLGLFTAFGAYSIYRQVSK